MSYLETLNRLFPHLTFQRITDSLLILNQHSPSIVYYYNDEKQKTYLKFVNNFKVLTLSRGVLKKPEFVIIMNKFMDSKNPLKCNICLDEDLVKSNPICKNCGELVCHKCIRLLTDNVCPVCRQIMGRASIRYLWFDLLK